MKKSYIILIGVFIIFILGFVIFGYFYISHKLIKDSPEFNIVKFEEEIKYSIIQSANDFGSVRIYTFHVSDNFELCIFKNGEVISHYNNRIYNFSMEQIRINNNFCVKPVSNLIKLRFAGVGNATNISILNSTY